MIILDASVVVKWFLREPGHDEAIEIVRSMEVIAAPDLVIPEVMNVLRRKERQGLITSEQLMSAAETISDAFVRLVPARELVEIAVSLSRALDHSVYDCFYLACAVTNGCMLITADEVFFAKAMDKGHSEAVTTLAGWIAGRHQETSDVDDPIVSSVISLHNQFEKTIEGVRDAVSVQFGSPGRRLVNTGDLAPAYKSPAYVKLVRFIASLNRSERAKLLGLGWFGSREEVMIGISLYLAPKPIFPRSHRTPCLHHIEDRTLRRWPAAAPDSFTRKGRRGLKHG